MRLCVPRERNIVCITVPWTLQTAQAHSRPLNNHFLKKENSEEKKQGRKKEETRSSKLGKRRQSGPEANGSVEAKSDNLQAYN